MVKIALLGAGRVAQHYRDILQLYLSDTCTVVDVCDIKASKAESLCEAFGASFYTSLDELLTKTSADAIFILTPSGLHFEHACTCLDAGFHILVEKPVTMTLDEALHLERLAQRVNKKVCVAFQNRFNLSIQYLKSVIESQQLGKINLINLRLTWCREQEYYNDGWHGTWKMDGGVCNQQAIHHLDILANYFGTVKRVSALEARLMNNLQAEDTMLAIAEFDSGAVATISLTTAARPKDIEAVISVHGSNGSIGIGGIAVNRIEYSSILPEKLGYSNKDLSDFSEDFPTGYGLSHRHLVSEFCASIAQDYDSPVPIDSTYKTINLVHSLYSSSERKAWVSPNHATVSERLGK